MGIRALGRFMLGVVLGGAVGLLVARKSVGEGAEVFSLQRGPTMLALGIGALGGGIAMVLSSQGHSKAGLTVMLVTGLLLAFVTIVIETNAANVL
jgi:hypothetical protein